LAATAFIGLLHMPVARPLLALIGQCPVGHASASEIEEAQDIALRMLRGTTPAPVRPALGFVLETTTIEQVRAWARSHGVSCESSREDTLLTCIKVPATALGSSATVTLDEIAFGFRLRDRHVVNVTTLSSGLSATAAARAFTTIAGGLAARLGPPPIKRLPTPEWAGRGPAFVRYRFADYIADVTAIGLPGRGVVLKEHYLSATDIAIQPAAVSAQRSN
jgi:hypothetical protein